MQGEASDQTRFQMAPAYRELLQAEGLDSLQALLTLPDTQSLQKPGLPFWRNRTMLRLADGQRLFVKTYRRPPLREQLRQRLRGYRATAEIEWYWAHRLRRLGLNAPEPVAMGYQRLGPLEHRSVLVTAAVDGQSLERWLPAQDPASLPRPLKRQLLAATADLVALFHTQHLVHRDLYLSHLFIHPNGSQQPPSLAIIDLQRMTRPLLRWRRWQVKDLASLNYSLPPAALSTTDRLRWLKHYRGVRRLSPRDRRLIRSILRKTRRIARHSRKNDLG